MLYNWAAENPDKVHCIVGISPVCDLRSYPGLTIAASAYGMTPADLDERLNNITRSIGSNRWLVRDRYKALGGKMEHIVVPGQWTRETQEPRLMRFLHDGAAER